MLHCIHCNKQIDYDDAKMCQKCEGALCRRGCPNIENVDGMGRSSCQPHLTDKSNYPTEFLEAWDRLKASKA